MGSRLNLQTLLEATLGSDHVYFQPPSSLRMEYPAIVYELDHIKNSYANGGVYSSKKRYKVTVIDKNPDSSIIDRVNSLPTCEFDRAFQKDNLNQTVFNLYY